MHANGSGYLAEMMSHVREAYRSKEYDDVDFSFDIVPVRTWQQLVARSKTSRWVSSAVIFIHMMVMIMIKKLL